MNSCRFCLKTLNAEENVFEISEKLKDEFVNFTQTTLIESPIHSNIVCELCFRSLHQGIEFKNQLVKNQKFVQEVSGQFDAKSDNYGMELINLNDLVPVNDYEYQCEICQKPFKSAGSLRQHKRLHNPFCDIRIKCEVCGKGYKGRGSLNNHKLLHEKPQFQCDLCSMGIYSRSSLKYHMISQHLKMKNFKCTLCPKEYFKNSDLLRHIHTVHDKMKYVCRYQSCGKEFKRIELCRSHICEAHKLYRKSEIDTLITILIDKANKEKNSIKTVL